MELFSEGAFHSGRQKVGPDLSTEETENRLASLSRNEEELKITIFFANR